MDRPPLPAPHRADAALRVAIADRDAAELVRRIQAGLTGADGLAVALASQRGVDLLATARAICKALRAAP